MRNYALLLIDVQQAFRERDATGANRSCRDAEQNISRLLTVFRAESLPIIHVHHHSKEEGSAFGADRSGVAVQPFAAPQGDEPVIVKHVNSAFIGTDLEAQLDAIGRPKLVICGATANHCVETTTRMAGNLGFDAFYIGDAVWAYDHSGVNGALISAEQIHAVSMANLHGEFARVLSCDLICARIAGEGAT
jgi:nicotinamidase-related amidase